MASEQPQASKEEQAQRDAIARAGERAKEKRKNIFREIKKIQPEAGKNLKDLRIPQSLYEQARSVAREEAPQFRFTKVPVYELLVEHIRYKCGEAAVGLTTAGPVLEGWKVASVALFRYALNLILAPKRAEFKKMKLSSSYYVYNISRNLHNAETVFVAMGYTPTDKREKKETQDLVYEGDVKPALLLETATDLLVMHEEICLLQDMVKRLLDENRDVRITLGTMVAIRQNTPTHDDTWRDLIKIAYTPDTSKTQADTYSNVPSPTVYGGEHVSRSEASPAVIQAHEEMHATNHGYANIRIPPDTASPQIYGQPEAVGSQATLAPLSPPPYTFPPSTSSSHPPPAYASNQQSHYPQGAVQPHYHQDLPSTASSQMPQQYSQFGAAGNFHHATTQGYGQPPLSPSHHPQSHMYTAPGVTHQSQHVAVSQSQPAVQPGVQPVWDGTQASNPTMYQNHPQMFNPTEYKNWPPQNQSKGLQYRSGTTQDYPSQNVAYHDGPNSTHRSGHHSRNLPHTGHDLSVTPHPPTTVCLQHHQTQSVGQPSSECVEEEEEEHNVLRQAMDAGLRSPGGRGEGDKHVLEASGEMSFNVDNLPPPMTNFTSPMTPCPEPGLPSGLISGLPNSQSGGNGHVSFSLSGSSGPVGMQIPENTNQSPITEPNHPIGPRTASTGSDSTPSLDLYSSGPNLQRLSSSSTGFPPVPEEHVQGQSVLGALDATPVSPHPTPRHNQPTLVTQDSQDMTPHALPGEPCTQQPRPVPKPRQSRLPSKAQSVDEVEDQHRQEKTQHGMRTSQSGSNLMDMERNSPQISSHKLTKPCPPPRRSRSPSPASSTENSPRSSPTPKRRGLKHPTHETWNLPSSEPPSAMSGQVKTRTLPPKAQSVDTDPQQSHKDQEMPHFASGSNLLDASKELKRSKHLPLNSATARRPVEEEPDTPVKGLLPSQVMTKKKALKADAAAPSKVMSRASDQTPQTTVPPSSSSSQPTANKPSSNEQLLYPSQPAQPSVHSNQRPLTDGNRTSRSMPPISPKSEAVVSTTTAVAGECITSKPDESRLDYGGEATQALRQSAHHDRSALYPGEEPVTRGRANAVESVRREKGTTDEKSSTKDAAKASTTPKKGFEDTGEVVSEIEQKFGISLSETWECSYCTNLVASHLEKCDICTRPR